MNIAVLGTPEHEGRICGRAFELLGVQPSYVLDELPDFIDDRHSRPDLLVVSREWSLTIRAAVARARRRNIPVVYVMDGIIEWSYIWNNLSYVRPEGSVLQPLLASHLCVIGRHPARILAGLGLADHLHIVGMPRLDGVDRRRVVDPATPPSIVVTTARTAAHNVEQKTFVRRALRDLKGWFDAHGFVRPVWRISPELAAEFGLPLDDAPLMETLRHANALVSFASTTLLEGMLLGIPTAVVDYRAVPQYVQTGWEIRSSDHVEGVLHDLLHPRPERLALQDWCLREELEPGDASARLADVLRCAASDTRPTSRSTAAAPAADYGRLDYRQVHSELSAFAVSPSSVLQYELDAVSKLLDISMPEIVRLRAEAACYHRQLHEQSAVVEGQRVELDRLSVALEQRRSDFGEKDAEASFRKRVHMSRLRPFARRLEAAGVSRITIYGAGDVGRALIALCRELGITVRRVVDRDDRLWGRTIDGIDITSLEACRTDRAPVIAVASLSHARAMRTAVKQTLGPHKRLRIFSPAPWRI